MVDCCAFVVFDFLVLGKLVGREKLAHHAIAVLLCTSTLSYKLNTSGIYNMLLCTPCVNGSNWLNLSDEGPGSERVRLQQVSNGKRSQTNRATDGSFYTESMYILYWSNF